MRLATLLFCLTLSFACFGQSGNYFLSHFSPDEERFNIMCFDIEQDDRGVFYFATQAGILQFDGRNWDIISAAGTVYSITRSEDGEIYVAGSGGFGKIGRDDYGMEVYQPLHQQEGTEYIFQIITLPGSVYFLSEKNLFEYSLKSGEIKVQPATEQAGSFVALHEIFGKVYISSEENGLFEFKSGKLVPSDLGLAGGSTLIFSLRYKGRYLLGTDDNKIFLLRENQRVKMIGIRDSVYANTSVITNATWVNDNLIALGTLRGGVMFINPTNGATEEIINYNTGLRDNEVFAMICDKNQNVLVAHAYGFTRIAPYLPFRSFRYYPGLQGNLLCATTYQGKVFVGTSAGLFKLEKEEFYDEITYFVDVPVKTRQRTKAKEQTTTAPVEDVKKGGFFSFLKRKKKEEPPPAASRNNTKTPVPKQKYKREKRTKKILRSAYYAYKKVEGVDSKITQLLHWKGRFIAAGLSGAYEVGPKTTQIIQEPIRFLFASEKSNALIASTYDDKLHRYKFDKTWTAADPIENISGPINYIFEEDKSTVWFCGFDRIFRMNISDTAQNIQTLSIDKGNFDQLMGICFNKQVYIATSSGFFFYDSRQGRLVEGDTLRKPVAYFASSKNLWFRDKHSWYIAGQTSTHNNLQLLNLFNNIRFIDSDGKNESLWIITGNNELLQFNNGEARKDEVLFPLILKSIENNNTLVPRKNVVEVQQEHSSIKAEVIRPDFIGARFIEYRYLLEGLNPQWSDWSVNNNIVTFPYLPTGDYKLLIQSKDIFGRTNELDPVSIEVVPPYWKQTWFYAVEFSFFVLLVIVSFRLSYRFIWISRILSLLSIIIFIEFIQTIAGSTFSTHSTPVFDFAIQVGIAFMILPIEGFLRRHFLQAIDKRNQLKLQREKGNHDGKEEVSKKVKAKALDL